MKCGEYVDEAGENSTQVPIRGSQNWLELVSPHVTLG